MSQGRNVVHIAAVGFASGGTKWHGPVFPKIYPMCNAVRAQLLRLRAGREASKILVYTAGRFVRVGEIFSGPALSIVYNTLGLTPNGGPRTPDIIVTPNIGMTCDNDIEPGRDCSGCANRPAGVGT